MSLLRPFSASDLFEFNAINLDVWTETYGVNYYLSYLSTWPDLFSYVYQLSGEHAEDQADEDADCTFTCLQRCGERGRRREDHWWR